MAAGLHVNGRAPHDAALSTHALLHGRVSEVAQMLAEVAASLKPGAPLFATFGSQRDARFGKGAQVDAFTYAAASGDEAGVPHCYFGEADLRRLLEPLVTIESSQEMDVDQIAGRWAHATEPLRGAVHWFVRATIRGTNTSG